MKADQLDDVPSNEDNVQIRDPALTNGQLSSFLAKHKLRVLAVTGSKHVTAAGLASLTHSPDLQSLDVSDTSVADDVVEVLVQIKTLEILRLSGTQVRNLSKELFIKCPRLWSLDLGECAVTKQLIETCVTYGALREIRLNACEGLSLEALAILATSKTLQEVFLNGNRVNAETVSELCKIASVRSVSIYNATGITGDEVMKLRQSYPHVKIIFNE